MNEAEYKKLLDKAYADLPEVLYKKKRFEIPPVKGKLIKTRTIISNFGEIAKHFERKLDHFLKFMLREVGVRGEANAKGELTLHSRFQPTALNKAVEKYYKNYVECSHCNSPDTILNNNNSEMKCNACGHQEKVSQL